MVGNFLRVPKLPKTALFLEFRARVGGFDVCEIGPVCRDQVLGKMWFVAGNLIFGREFYLFVKLDKV